MSRFVRDSKVRHVYADPPKLEQCFSGLSLSTATGDHNYIKANATFVAVALQGGGGPLAILRHDKIGRVARDVPHILGHTSAVLDFDFMPSHDQIIATGSDDCTVKVWGIPSPEGLTENLTEPLCDLHGHERKVTHVKFHPTASNVLVTTSADNSVKLWDIEQNKLALSSSLHEALICDVDWSHNGSMLATTCKDKKLRLIDPRTDAVAACVEAHTGSKSVKVCYLGKRGTLITTGFTKQSKRQITLWDPRNMSEGIQTQDLDQAAGVMMPFFDDSLNILYVAGKGDGNIRYFEITSDDKIFPISEHRGAASAKGCGMVPKKACDTTKCEVTKLVKLTNNGTIEPLSFILPRKSDIFQSDIFPDCASGAAGATNVEYFGGKDGDVLTMSMKPGEEEKKAEGPTKTVIAMKSSAQLQRELDTANAKIASLEAELAKLKA